MTIALGWPRGSVYTLHIDMKSLQHVSTWCMDQEQPYIRMRSFSSRRDIVWRYGAENQDPKRLGSVLQLGPHISY